MKAVQDSGSDEVAKLRKGLNMMRKGMRFWQDQF